MVTPKRLAPLPEPAPEEEHHPRRVTVSQLALQLASRAPANPTSSVQLSLNAKGDVQIAVDVNDRDPLQASALAQELFDALQAKYPRTAAAE